MNFEDIKSIYFVGAGGIGMSALLRYFMASGMPVGGYDKTPSELTKRLEEEGIIFDLLTNPTEIIADENGWVKGIKCVKMELGEPDESGRRSPKAVPGSEFVIPVDCVIMSLGTSPNPLLKATTPGLQTLRRGEIAVDEVGKTSIEGVYCGGDAATGAATGALGAGAALTSSATGAAAPLGAKAL